MFSREAISQAFPSSFDPINSVHTYNFNPSSGNKADSFRFPILYYISISSLDRPNVSQLLQSRSRIDLANDIWLIVLENTDDGKKSVESLSKQLGVLVPNLDLDSQVIVIRPMDINCDNFNVHEIYKV